MYLSKCNKLVDWIGCLLGSSTVARTAESAKISCVTYVVMEGYFKQGFLEISKFIWAYFKQIFPVLCTWSWKVMLNAYKIRCLGATLQTQAGSQSPYRRWSFGQSLEFCSHTSNYNVHLIYFCKCNKLVHWIRCLLGSPTVARTGNTI